MAYKGSSTEVTMLLNQVRTGDAGAQQRLVEVVYDELRRVTGGLMSQERADHTLQPTALVNEAMMRLLAKEGLKIVPNRRYFFAAAVCAMRRVLVDHAKARRAEKRGGRWKRVQLDDVMEGQPNGGIDIEMLDGALNELAAWNPRQAQVVMLRFFGGLSMNEIAEHLDVSLSTVEAEFRVARAWLHERLA